MDEPMCELALHRNPEEVVPFPAVIVEMALEPVHVEPDLHGAPARRNRDVDDILRRT